MSTHDLLILTSPPASGKTYWISEFQKETRSKDILVISPLRALADECRSKWGDLITVMTPEEWLSKKVMKRIVIVDEFHLFFYWGDTFRPLMWEMFYEVSTNAQLTVLLTATLSQEMIQEISLFRCQFDSLSYIDCGNRSLKYPPKVYLKAPSKIWIKDVIFQEEKASSVKLIFCKYRTEVFQWEKELSEKGFSCVTCVGGESKHMAARLKEVPRPDFIIATTVLSHGVNLPMISKIFFTYKTENIDFWVQMTARGGRKGEEYIVVAMEKPFTGIKFNFFRNLISLFFYKLKSQLLHSLH